MENTERYPHVDAETGFCGAFDRIDASLIEETEYCGVCKLFDEKTETCRKADLEK